MLRRSVRHYSDSTKALLDIIAGDRKSKGKNLLRELAENSPTPTKKAFHQTQRKDFKSLTQNNHFKKLTQVTNTTTHNHRDNNDLRSPSRKTSTSAHATPQTNDIFTRFNPVTFNYKESLSLRENEFYTDLLKRVFETSRKFQVLLIDTGAPAKMHLKKVLSSLQDNEIVDIVDMIEQDGETFPLLRKMNKESVLKTFSDKKSIELSKLYGRTREKKRDSNVKFVKVSWEISQMDLENQKRNEIMSQWLKGVKITIAIDSKDNFHDLRGVFDTAFSQENSKLHDLEKLKREKTLEFLKTMFEGIADIDVLGDIKGRVIINVTPTANDNKRSDKKSGKDQKKLDRIQKQKLREEQKKAKLDAKAKEFEKMMANSQ